ncbi:MAG: hypothetical protein QOC84_1089 [Bradyrhizobium sp.]|jgi:hypothetical protein|nr:hypothetical protein [Bradyrhizobium sp.]
MPGTSSAKTRFALLAGHDELEERGLRSRDDGFDSRCRFPLVS